MKLFNVRKKEIVLFYKYLSDLVMYYSYLRETNKLMKINHISNVPMPGEEEWKSKWKKLFRFVNEKDYRLFYGYFDSLKDIVPESALHAGIERILNPFRYRHYYSDKNIFDLLFSKGALPLTIIRSMRNIDSFLDINYKPIQDPFKLMWSFDKIVVKPSVDSDSGKGVELLLRCEDGYKILSSGEMFTLQWLKEKYGTDFIMQECLEQSSYMAQFNKTSVNTIRICVYRSVVDGTSHVTSAVLRIGKDGSFVDNGHAGGNFVGINKNGQLNKYVCNQYGQKNTCFNGIDFSSTLYEIPEWERIIAFAETVGNSMPHHHLLALDVMLDGMDTPRLIEVNTYGFSIWLFLFSGLSVWGEYTDEIMEYCIQRKNEEFYMKSFLS